MEEKLLFQKQKEFVSAIHKLMGRLQSATASQHAEATKEGVFNETISETSQKKY